MYWPNINLSISVTMIDFHRNQGTYLFTIKMEISLLFK